MITRIGLGLVALCLLAFPAFPASAQISQGVRVCDPSYPSRCIKPAADGSIAVTGGGGGAGDASAANQALQITQETAINTVLGTVTASPTANTIADRIKTTNTNLGITTSTACASSASTCDAIAVLKGLLAAAQDTTPVAISGAAASGASVSGNPLLDGCRAATAAPTAVTDGQAVAAQCDGLGVRIMRPYAVKELMVRGSTGAVANTAQTSIIASAGGSLKNYITAIQCANSGASTSILTFTDANATILINPAGGGGSWTFPVPLVTAAATAFQVTPGTASTSQYCSAQGYVGL